MSKTLKSGLLAVLAIVAAGQTGISAQTIDYSVVSVPEESGLELTKITNKGDYVCLPQVVRRGQGISWFSNRVLAPLPKSEEIAYLSFRNNATNIFIKDLLKQGGSRQRTNRTGVIDFSFSSDGKDLYFAETRGNTTSIFRTDAKTAMCADRLPPAQTTTPRLSTHGANRYSSHAPKTTVAAYGATTSPTISWPATHRGLTPTPCCVLVKHRWWFRVPLPQANRKYGR